MTQGSALSRVPQPQPLGGGDTHTSIPLHTQGRPFGAALPRHRRENGAGAASGGCRLLALPDAAPLAKGSNGRHVCGLWGEAALGNRALQRPGGCILSKSPGPT